VEGVYGVTVQTLGLAIGLFVASFAEAGVGPENTAVVVNADSWASLTVANEFVHLRQIPPDNVVYLSGLPDFEQTTVDAFREQLLKPVLDTLAQRGLTEQIDCVAYSADLPWGVNVSADMQGWKFPKVITPWASINGLTYLYEDVLGKDPRYLDLESNRYARRPLPQQEAQRIGDQQRERYAQALNWMQDKKWAEALPLLRELEGETPRSPDLLYNFACCLAQQNQPEEAVTALQRATENGFLNYSYMRADDDLRPLHGRDDFRALVSGLQNGDFEIQPTVGFRSSDRWNGTGESRPRAESKYLLSTMLAVTSGRGNSVSEALAYLRRSAAADGTRPRGAVYYLVNGDIRSRTRQWGVRPAARKLAALGVRAEVIEGTLPPGKPDVAGAMVGSAGFDWAKSGSTMLSGAICEHLTSFGGVLTEGSGQTPLTDFLRYGAAGSSGTVTEPYALQQKFPDPFLHVHYAKGCTLAEAFYQSVTGPYQLLIVGDPLCQPWARIPRPMVSGIRPDQVVSGPLRLRPSIRNGQEVRAGRFELFVDGRRHSTCPPGRVLRLDTTAEGDGYHELGLVAVAAEATETRGSLVVPFQVNNYSRELRVTAPARRTLPWGDALTLSAQLPGAKGIAFFHNARLLATLTGAAGQVAIDTRLLGMGPVRLHAVAWVPAARDSAAAAPDHPNAPPLDPTLAKVWDCLAKGGLGAGGSADTDRRAFVTSCPVELMITPPPALLAVSLDATVPVANGLQLVPEGGKPAVVESTRPRDWLAKAGVKEGQPFTLEGYFDMPADDVYQLQVRFDGTLALAVDGQPLTGVKETGWSFLPVALKAGTHRLRVSAAPKSKPALDLRFGGPGAVSVGADRFRCAATPVGE